MPGAKLGVGDFRVQPSAEISECGLYRWWLKRIWRPGPIVCFVMLNPSTADANINDSTVRKCIGFAWRWGFAGIEVRNLYPFRATDPKDMVKAKMKGTSVTGGDRGLHELLEAKHADLVVAAWGTKAGADRTSVFFKGMEAKPIYCIGRAVGGDPFHPLYQQYTKKPEPFVNCEGHFYADVLGEINKCQFCIKESPKHLWVKDACPCCGEKYDYILAQDSEE
jgi:hypothetical protein